MSLCICYTILQVFHQHIHFLTLNPLAPRQKLNFLQKRFPLGELFTSDLPPERPFSPQSLHRSQSREEKKSNPTRSILFSNTLLCISKLSSSKDSWRASMPFRGAAEKGPLTPPPATGKGKKPPPCSQRVRA